MFGEGSAIASAHSPSVPVGEHLGAGLMVRHEALARATLRGRPLGPDYKASGFPCIFWGQENFLKFFSPTPCPTAQMYMRPAPQHFAPTYVPHLGQTSKPEPITLPRCQRSSLSRGIDNLSPPPCFRPTSFGLTTRRGRHGMCRPTWNIPTLPSGTLGRGVGKTIHSGGGRNFPHFWPTPGLPGVRGQTPSAIFRQQLVARPPGGY